MKKNSSLKFQSLYSGVAYCGIVLLAINLFFNIHLVNCNKAKETETTEHNEYEYELLPCPFCKSEVLLDSFLNFNHDKEIYQIVCPECRLETKCFDSETDAVKYWNNR